MCTINKSKYIDSLNDCQDPTLRLRFRYTAYDVISSSIVIGPHLSDDFDIRMIIRDNLV